MFFLVQYSEDYLVKPWCNFTLLNRNVIVRENAYAELENPIVPQWHKHMSH